jgi:hypothetical protein
VCDLQSNVAFDHDHHRAVDDHDDEDHVQVPDSSLSLSLSLSREQARALEGVGSNALAYSQGENEEVVTKQQYFDVDHDHVDDHVQVPHCQNSLFSLSLSLSRTS